jgi:hypothetical protein
LGICVKKAAVSLFLGSAVSTGHTIMWVSKKKVSLPISFTIKIQTLHKCLGRRKDKNGFERENFPATTSPKLTHKI